MEDSQIANTRPYFGFASALSITSPSYSNGNGFSTTINESLILEQSPPPYVYFAKNNTLTFMSLDPHITILTAGRSTLKKFNITTDAFPSWVHGPVFVVYGHVDPTLVFLSGAEVNATVINIDGDMLHNFACTSASYAGVALASIQPLMF
ncbi:MAG: hypothetical protein M1368_06440, partial [Thaumarchaeota archaeon]|nr:hypothetical protein [Nitrososphaerota archaeon]